MNPPGKTPLQLLREKWEKEIEDGKRIKLKPLESVDAEPFRQSPPWPMPENWQRSGQEY